MELNVLERVVPMKITPLDIKKHEFTKAFRGFDSDEVNAFLEMLSEEMLNLQTELDALRVKNIQMETQVADYKNLEEKWKTTMISAQESAEKALEASKREADIIRREAEIKAEEILNEARKNALRYKEEMELLKSEKRSFIKRLKHLISSQLELIDVLENDEN